LDKIQGYRRNWFQHINGMPRNRLPKKTKKLQTKRQKELGETIMKTSLFMRPERVSKWPDRMLDDVDDDVWWAAQIISCSICSLLHSPVTSSILGPNISLSTQFSNTLSLRSTLKARDQVLHPYKTGETTALVRKQRID
jgi:hypothetical protein